MELNTSDLESGSVTGLELTIRTSGESGFTHRFEVLVQSFRVRRELSNKCAFVVLFS